MRRHVWRRQLLSFVCLFILLTVVFSAIQPVAEAQVTLVGSWDISGRIRTCVKVRGSRKVCATVPFVDNCFQAFEDGSIDWLEQGVGTADGTWVKKRGKKFLINLDKDDYAVLFEIACEELGVSCNATISTARVKVKLKKTNNRLSGKIRIIGRITILGQSAKFRVKGNFTGTRTDGCVTFDASRETSDLMLTNLSQQIILSIIK
ncbi:MAG: hypothetical protein ACUZ77_04610 [Candidatus Brocadiales bacterium]